LAGTLSGMVFLEKQVLIFQQLNGVDSAYEKVVIFILFNCIRKNLLAGMKLFNNPSSTVRIHLW
jgi:hypothetical protein